MSTEKCPPENSVSQLTICALGFRHPCLRWEKISAIVKDKAQADAFVSEVKKRNEWPHEVRESFRALSEPRLALERAEVDLARLEEIGAHVVIPESLNYPANLDGYAQQPIILSYVGSPFWVGSHSLSIVGSREPRTETLRWMDHELPLVARSGISFFSGGARGVDQKAHGIAIRCEIPTGVILPSGLANLYPADLKSWVDDVLASGGAFISEFAPDQEMRRHHFLQRNRIVAGISGTTLVAQCGFRSGTWITAQYARDIHGSVAVLPGSVWDAQFKGSLDLFYEGAYPVRDGADLLTQILNDGCRNKDLERAVLNPGISQASVGNKHAEEIGNPNGEPRDHLA